MILGADNRKPWSKMDVLIAQAYQTIQDEKCGQHGGPRWMCDHEDQSLDLKIEEQHCYAKQELQKEEEGRKDKEEPGVVLYPRFYSRAGRDLSTYRTSYYEQKAREAAEDSDD